MSEQPATPLGAPSPSIVIVDGATKGHIEHVVPMSGFVAAELLAAGLPAKGYCFRRADGQRGPNSPWMISYMCNQHLHGCGYPETLHQLRHRFATNTYRRRRDVIAVQRMLGHASIASTQIYADFDQAEAAADVEALAVPSRHLRLIGPLSSA